MYVPVEGDKEKQGLPSVTLEESNSQDLVFNLIKLNLTLA